MIYLSLLGSQVSLGDSAGNINATNYQGVYTAIMLPPVVFSNKSNPVVNVVFSSFSSSELYPLVNKTMEGFEVASNIISATILGSASKLNGNVSIILMLNNKVSYSKQTFVFIMKVFLLAFPNAQLCFLG